MDTNGKTARQRRFEKKKKNSKEKDREKNWQATEERRWRWKHSPDRHTYAQQSPQQKRSTNRKMPIRRSDVSRIQRYRIEFRRGSSSGARGRSSTPDKTTRYNMFVLLIIVLCSHVFLVEGLEGLGVNEVVKLDHLVRAPARFRGGLFLRLFGSLSRLFRRLPRRLKLGLTPKQKQTVATTGKRGVTVNNILPS